MAKASRYSDAVDRRFRLEQRRYLDWEGQEDRIRALVPKAIKTLSDHFDGAEPSPQVALAILKLAEQLSPRMPQRTLVLLNAELYDLPDDEDDA
jgi:hypothetical protein